MSLLELTETIVKSLVKDPDSISAKVFEEEELVIIEVMVPDDEAGSVIGKEGRIANAIRTVVQASSYLKDNKKVRININVF